MPAGRRHLAVPAAMLLMMATAAAAEDCGGETACTVEGGQYFVLAPEAAEGRPPVLLFFHGWGSSGDDVLRNPVIRDAALGRGFVLLAPQGLVPPGRKNRGWSHQGSPQQLRDEVAFVHRVLDDLARRVAYDRGRILVSGFSQGGSMAWHLACFDGAGFAGFAPVAGAFWEPAPEECPGGPVELVHLHGFTDRVVPLEGREIDGRWHQADAFAGLGVLRAADGCRSDPSAYVVADGYRCRIWTGCASGRALELCLHDGGHDLPADWLGRVLDRYLQTGRVAGEGGVLP